MRILVLEMPFNIARSNVVKNLDDMLTADLLYDLVQINHKEKDALLLWEILRLRDDFTESNCMYIAMNASSLKVCLLALDDLSLRATFPYTDLNTVSEKAQKEAIRQRAEKVLNEALEKCISQN